MKKYTTEIEEYLFRVDRLWEEGEWAEGLKVLEYVLYEEPGHGKAHAWYAWFAYVKSDDFPLAEIHYDLALKFDPSFPGTYVNFVHVLMAMKNYRKAIKVALLGTKAPAVDVAYMYNEVGRAYMLLEDYKNALYAFKKAMKNTMDKDELATYKYNVRLAKKYAAVFRFN
jgi:tetratricopeptide (TPR) repeat protein